MNKIYITAITAITAICLLAVFFGLFYTNKNIETDISFHIIEDQNAVEISMLKLEDGVNYVFLPTYSELSQVEVELTGKSQVFLNGQRLIHGDNCGRFELDTKYEMVIDGNSSWIEFKRSDNVATLYIDTVTGDMDRVHSDADFEETASVILYRVDGTVDYHEDICYIKGRGNTTWGQEKKPYLLKLSNDANLLGMGESSKWVLLANSHDESNLNNKLVFDIATELGLKYTPNSEYVDVYLNGEYNGLYLLTEKIDGEKNQVGIDYKNGDFLCRVEYPDRWSIIRNPIESQSGRVLETVAPKFPTEEELLRIKEKVDRFERELLRGDYRAVIDEESWIKKYLIDEISGNGDADVASSFFYYTGGMMYAGPVWDYDVTFGNYFRNENPNSFVAKNEYKYSGAPSVYYYALYTNPSFYQNMTETYKTEMLPLLEEYIDSKIDNLANSISVASALNSFRWKEMYESIYLYDGMTKATSDTIRDYLNKRVEFFNDVWINGVSYCNIQLEIDVGAAYRNVAIKSGNTFDPSNYGGEVWIIKGTGEIFDKNKPVYDDMVLTLQQEVIEKEPQQYPVESETRTIGIRYIIVAFSALSMGMLFLLMMIIDVVRTKKQEG